ncbi:MAG: hypothetical protein Q8T13_00330 [Acidobacteriota bacterium]|nr:hypothetical protein [Acidobacteriota bacterium]
MALTSRPRAIVVEAAVVLALFGLAFAVSLAAMRQFREAGVQPFFYQSNFEPAVMMACGRGFGIAASPPQELAEFLQVKRDAFDCALLPDSTSTRPLTSAANANWYYLYGASAGVWGLTGVSWTALDVLVSLMSAVSAVMLFGLFRTVAGPAVSVVFALLLVLSPANLTRLLSLRDYSKAPFVLAAIWILAVLLLRPLSRARMLALAGLYGAVVGFGYGFRTDLALMVPFGALMVALFPPGALRANWLRNGLAAGVLLFTFAVVAAPVIGGLKLGGCQYHFSLLGLTTPLTQELRLTSSIYRFGDQLTDEFIEVKAADFASRILDVPVPAQCSAEYDAATGQLYTTMATTFPADLVVRAYASVLMILRVGLAVPEMMQPVPPFPASAVASAGYAIVNRVTSLLAPAGPLLVMVAIGIAWAQSARLGLALSIFVLFLGGYPAIRFEERHWFHLRFLPWWAALVVIAQVLPAARRAWTQPAFVRGALGVAGLLFALAGALGAARVIQAHSVEVLVGEYLAAPTEAVASVIERGSFVRVDWHPQDYGVSPQHWGSDLLSVSVEPALCGAAPPAVRVTYQADGPRHDLSTTLDLPISSGNGAPTRLFIPVFWKGLGDQTNLKFDGLEVVGGPGSCLGPISKVSARAVLPLWIHLQADADWSGQPLYQSMKLPRLLSRQP